MAFIANNNLGGILLARGELEPAAELFERALRVKPDYEEGFDNLGQVRQRQGRLDEAIGFYREALRCEPKFANAHNNLGIVLAQQGKIAEAYDEFAAAVADKPTFAKAHQNLGIILERQGRTGDAVVAYRETLRLSSPANDVELRLAWILATDPDASVRNGAEAIRRAQSAASSTGGKDPQAFDVLAAAFAEAGRFDEAVEAGERALALAGPSAAGGAVEGAKARLALYRARQPFRRQAP
jgi:tetratricopeptide (TPR) repeat protein